MPTYDIHACHIKTEEPCSPGLCLGVRTLDSLLIEDKQPILMGFAPDPENKRLGEIWCYPVFSLAYDRAMALANGQRSHEGQALLGMVFKSLYFDESLVERIRQNYHPRKRPTFYPLYRECEPEYDVTERMRLPFDYDGSTEQLILILAHTKNGGGGRRKPVKEKLIPCAPNLKIAPAF